MTYQKALYFEDFQVDQVFETGARTVTETDVQMFAMLSGDYNPLHTDAEFARHTPFGQRIAHGLLGLSMTSGLISRLGVVDGTILAFLEISWRFLKPIVDGDTIRVSAKVTSVRQTKSNPNRGVVTLDVVMRNQAEEEVQRGVFTYLMACRPKSD